MRRPSLSRRALVAIAAASIVTGPLAGCANGPYKLDVEEALRDGAQVLAAVALIAGVAAAVYFGGGGCGSIGCSPAPTKCGPTPYYDVTRYTGAWRPDLRAY